MKTPLIGITCGTKQADKGPQDRLNQAYSRAVSLAGGAPVILPNLESAESISGLLDRLDGLLLSGGADVAPAEFGEDVFNETVEVDPPRDAWELALIRVAVERDIPILAICRGIQSLNVALGGTLIQDLPAQRPTGITHRQAAARSVSTHEIRLDSQCSLARIAGEQCVAVNSFHHQAIDRLADGLRITGEAADGIIEAVEVPGSRFLVGVQYHPEELVDTQAHARRLFEAFVRASSR